jgi:hypothetical protein
MRRTRTRAAALALTVGVAAASFVGITGAATATASTHASQAASPINVLDITGTSGATAIFGTQETLGMQAAAAYYNKRGGILGHKINIDVVNDNSDPATAASLAAQKLGGGGASKYTMVWAGQEGTTSAAIIPIVKKDNVYVTAVNDGNGQCQKGSSCPNIFLQASDLAAGEAADTAALKAAGYKKIGIIQEQGTYDQSEYTYMGPDLKKAGISTDVVTFPPTAVSLTPEMQQLKGDGVQAVFAMTLGPAGGYVLGARSALAWNIPIQFDVAGSTVNLPGLAPSGTTLTHVKETDQYCENTKATGIVYNELVKYSPKPLAGDIECSIAGDGWQAIVMLADAAAKAKSLTASALIKATTGLKISSNLVSFPTACWTSSDHEDTCQNNGYYGIVPLGTLKNTRLYPLAK